MILKMDDAGITLSREQKLLECIRNCGVTFHICDSTKKDFSFTSLVGKDKLDC